MKKLKRISGLCLFFLCWQINLQAQTLIFKNFSVNQGLASSTVYSICQDSKGFLWFGTESGVNRYNGQTFELFTIDNGLSDNEVLNIKEDSKGRIWFLTLNGKLSYYFNNKIYNSQNDPLLKRAECPASFVSFFEDSKGNLWFSTNQNLLIEITDENKAEIHRPAPYSLANTFITENAKNELLFINNEHWVVYKNKRFSEQKQVLKPLNFKTILSDKKNRGLFYLADSSLVSYHNTETRKLRRLPPALVTTPPGKFLVDKHNTLWLTTMGKGLYVLKGNSDAAENHLKGNIISDVILDDEDNLWVATIGNGVFMLPTYSHRTVYYTSSDGLSTNAVHSILRVDDRLILGLRNGGIDVIKHGKIEHYNLNNSNAYNPVKQLYYDKDRRAVWFASDRRLGELSVDDYRVNTLKEKNNSAYAVKSFSISKSGEIAVALASGVYLIHKGRDPLSFSAKPLRPENEHFLNRAFSVFYDSQERLWFSNINGLHCFNNEKVIHLYQTLPLLAKRITSIAELPDKSIICSTYGYGVFILKDFRLVKRITSANGLISNICRKVYIQDHAAWIVTGKGLSKIDFSNKAQVSNYSTENGLISSEINDVFIQNDTIYAATNQGVSILPVNKPVTKQPPPKLYLNYFHTNKRNVKIEKTITVSYRFNNITVNYIGLDFTNPSSVLYSYRLNPELRWNETANNSLEFAALEPGEYHLQLRAKSLNSGWSKAIEIHFIIEPPFWKTWWFLILLFVTLGIVLFQLINRFYRARREKEREDLLARTRIISLEQQALQAMMNPHFVFNVMNSIQYFINTKDNEMANRVLTGFARLIRKNLENCNKSYITIEEELSYLNLYLSLEKLRFGDRMNYSIEVDKDINQEETLIPSMLLQPFVENAIWHGLMPKETEGNIWIRIRKEVSGILSIEIEDDGIGIEQSKLLKSTDHISRGMELTNERIKLLSKFTSHPITLEIKQLVPQGTLVCITTPIQNRLLN